MKKEKKKKKTCPPTWGAGRRGPCGRLERPHAEMILRSLHQEFSSKKFTLGILTIFNVV
jgi:hypothetical protein